MNTAISAAHSDAAFYRNRQAMLMYPVIVLPFIAVLFWLFGGGKGERYKTEEAVANRAGSRGFNASVPNAKEAGIKEREVEKPGFGKAQVGQVLSSFTNSRQDSTSKGLNAIPVSNPGGTVATTYASSLATAPAGAASTETRRSANQSNAAAMAATRPARAKAGKGYYYNPPAARPYYNSSATDQQLDQQLQQYQRTGTGSASTPRTSGLPASSGSLAAEPSAQTNPAIIRLSDNLTATRLSEVNDRESPFLTAPTGGSRQEPTRAVLSGGNYGSRKTIAWMIPVVVHEDQAIRDGNTIKLRLLKEIMADGVTIPANTILHANCQIADDRLRLTVRNLQLGGQLIPLDLDVYDTDGSAGINVPGLGMNSQVGGQIRSSAIQGVNVPGIGGLGNTVLNAARMGASQSARQPTIRLRAGYSLFLKAP